MDQNLNAEKFSDRQIAGQRLMVGFDGTGMTDDLRYLIEELKVGGIILFAGNIVDPEQIQELCRSAQEHARAWGQPELFIAVDQEGGPVARLKPPHFTRFQGNPHLKNEADAARCAAVISSELKNVGINMDLAPVLDVAPKTMKSIMEGRAFGDDPEWVGRMGAKMIRAFQENGIMACAKHFPGIGRTTLDSHIELPFFDASEEDLRAFDLPPFQRAIEAHAATVMLSHITYTGIDPVWPASLSPAIVKDLLRKEMGYEGVVMTDDLDMGAISKYFDIRTAIRQIIAADIDIALICHRSANMEAAFSEMVKGVNADRVGALKSVARLMALKRAYL